MGGRIPSSMNSTNHAPRLLNSSQGKERYNRNKSVPRDFVVRKLRMAEF